MKGDVGPQGPQGLIGKPFTIAKVYSSSANLLADTAPLDIEAGEFAIVSAEPNTEENGWVYLWDGFDWTFVVDINPPSDHSLLNNLQGGIPGERYHLTEAQHVSLTSGTNSILHFHESDRLRDNHTGLQPAATISDFADAVKAVPVDGGYF